MEYIGVRPSASFSKMLKGWSGGRGSNPRRPAWEAGILPLNYPRALGMLRAPLRTRSLYHIRADMADAKSRGDRILADCVARAFTGCGKGLRTVILRSRRRS